MMLEVGTIVTIALKGYFLKGEQGKITKISGAEKTRFHVKFPNHSPCAFSRSRCYGQRGVFKKSSLQENTDWSSLNKARKIFGTRGWHATCFLKTPLKTNELCMHKECTKKRVRRIIWNCWGTITDVDVCEDHAVEFNGVCADDFPYRKNLAA